MQYRPEVDGLRAVAVVPIILSHAGTGAFSGGFVGVDVFFVISGYLLTTIIMHDLDAGIFSLAGFYERRARRILPALFLVMAASIPFAYLWMLPDEFKNFGQSLVATSLFSNNILLALTSDYWSLASEFKPLLHTWSLGVEEQYYIIFPLLMIALWKFCRRDAQQVLIILLILSLGTAMYGVEHAPTASFYLLTTRGWELLAGALTGYWLNYHKGRWANTGVNQLASLVGLSLISYAVIVFDASYPSPGLWLAIPVVGTVLIIVFAVEGTFANRLLASRMMVGIGLISYSLYLWHQPLFAFARVYAVGPVNSQVYALLIGATFLLAYLSWRLVEGPFRRHGVVSRRTLVIFAVVGSLSAISLGLYLNQSYGMAARIFGKDTKIADFDKRIYNERVFAYKTDRFARDDRRKILIIGNSFARDFVNMTIETFGTMNNDIVYRDDIGACIVANSNPLQQALLDAADIIVFASYDLSQDVTERNCISKSIVFAKERGKPVFFVGTKDFGRNLNWVRRQPSAARANLFNRAPDQVLELERRQKAVIPATNFISLLGPVMKRGMVPITDQDGRLISTDRRHLTKFGAEYFGERVIKNSAYGKLLAVRSQGASK